MGHLSFVSSVTRGYGACSGKQSRSVRGAALRQLLNPTRSLNILSCLSSLASVSPQQNENDETSDDAGRQDDVRAQGAVSAAGERKRNV